ncbi:MAG: AAA family ATPase [Clostridia bacterium]|nr:AAA family ATPase [Clostridia bacterium]
MSRTIVIASGKGGVGKSTLSAQLGMNFSLEGNKTLLVDCDAGLSSLDVMLGCAQSCVFSWYDIFSEQCNAPDALVQINENLFLLPSPKNAVGDNNENIIKDILSAMQDDFDIIIIDAPAGLNEGLGRAAAAAEFSIVVATADEVSVKAAAAVDKTLRDMGIKQSRLLINRYDIKAAKKGKLLTVDDIINKTYVQLLGIVPEDKNVMYSTVTGQINKKSKFSKAISRISQRISGKNVELSLSLLK